MKTSLRVLAVAAIACAAATFGFAAGEPTTNASSAGYVEFGALPAGAGTDLVQVNIRRPLIAIATKLVRTQEPEVAAILNGLQQIRVQVAGVTDENRKEILDIMGKLRSSVSGNGWENVVTVKQGDEDVGVSLKLKGEEAVEGILVTVMQGNEAILVNIVGNIRPEQIATVAEKLNIPQLKNLSKQIAATEAAE